MAIVNLTYCNASFGEQVAIDYDDVTHTIASGILSGGNCSPGLASGVVIHTQIDGNTRYEVRTDNSSPFAYVTQSDIDVCTVGITSVSITPATNDVSNDGVIDISASSNGEVSYSIGFGYQSSPIFTGLAPGTYLVSVRNLFFGAYCYDTESVIVGYSSIVECDLVLGNVAVTPGPGGTITVLGYVSSHLDQPVQYRIDSGAWQDSPTFTGLASGTYNVQIRYKNHTSCTDDRDVTLSACDVLLTGVNVIHEQSRFGNNGVITVLATSGDGPIEYSKNDGSSYQSSNVFSGLAPGTYNIRVKDAGLCEAFAIVVVHRYKAAIAEFPIANGNRVVVTSGPPRGVGVQNLDNTLAQDMRMVGKSICRFFQPYSVNDLVTIQWRSSYGAHTVKVYNMASVLQATLVASKLSSYLNKSESLSATFSNYGGGKTQIWFPAGIPTFFEIGQVVTISGVASLNGTYSIEDIVPGTGTALGNVSLIVSANYTSGTDPLTGTLTVIYDIEDFDVWETTVDWSAFAPGKYMIKWVGTDDQFAAFTAESEPVETLTDVSQLIAVRYRNSDNGFKIDSSSGIEHLVRVEGELLPSDPGGESEVMQDSRRRVVKLREYVTRILDFAAHDQPFYLLEKLKVAFAHDTVFVNDVEVQPSDILKVEYPSEMELVGIARVKLRDLNFLNENSDDAGDVDGVVLDLDNGDILGIDV